jgi:hypothetical protein
MIKTEEIGQDLLNRLFSSNVLPLAEAAAGCGAGYGPVQCNHRKERKALKNGQPRKLMLVLL